MPRVSVSTAVSLSASVVDVMHSLRKGAREPAVKSTGTSPTAPTSFGGLVDTKIMERNSLTLFMLRYSGTRTNARNKMDSGFIRRRQCGLVRIRQLSVTCIHTGRR